MLLCLRVPGVLMSEARYVYRVVVGKNHNEATNKIKKYDTKSRVWSKEVYCVVMML